jgi:hypothetical protein
MFSFFSKPIINIEQRLAELNANTKQEWYRVPGYFVFTSIDPTEEQTVVIELRNKFGESKKFLAKHTNDPLGRNY